MWDFLDFLPVASPEPTAGRFPGGTPLLPSSALARILGVAQVWIKDDTRNPSGSLKDRATAVALSEARAKGYRVVASASTGNAASSLACLSAGSGLRAVVFLPESAAPAKLAQVRLHGARVFPVRGDYDRAFDLCAEAVRCFGWFSRNTATNPYLGEGKKTAALEIASQLAWDAPDRVFIPVGDGAIYSGVAKGFRDLLAARWTETEPALVGVQAEGSASIADAFDAGLEAPRRKAPSTAADSISVALPRDGVKALKEARRTGGAFVRVPDEALFASQAILAREAGVFAEPAAAASLAGALALGEGGELGRGERIVLLVTGTGFKDVPAVLAALGKAPAPIEARIEEVERSLQEDPLEDGAGRVGGST